jgi:bacillithiol biosynthesis cysteine-adding enzyme BshC
MKQAAVPLRKTRLFSELLLDYIDGAPGLKPFYNLPPEPSSYAKLMEQRSFSPEKRKLLSDVLKEQYDRIPLDENSKVAKNIESLQHEITYTVTTGHQLNALTGPLYFIYKIVTAIKLSEELKAAHPDKHFVPVYWMATEDHDFAEISEVFFFGKKFFWKADENYKGAVGLMPAKSIAPLMDEVAALFKNDERALTLLWLFRNSYMGSANLAEATRKIAHALFGDYGLLVLDPDNAMLKKELVPVMRRDILKREHFTLINETNTKLQEKYKTQVNPREINFFYLLENARERIVFENGVYKVLNTDLVFSEAEMEKQVEEKPELFSPNVVMRPLYQELVLPNLAYIGGPAEVAYWLQLKKVFDVNGISFPILHLRDHFLIAGKGITNKLQSMKLDFEDLFADEQQLAVRFKKEDAGEEEGSLGSELENFRQLYGRISGSIGGKLDKELVNEFHSSFRAQLEMLKTIDRELQKYNRSRMGSELEAVAKLREKAFPGGQPQERIENVLAYYSFFEEDFISIIHQATDPFRSELKVLYV